jgi:glycosyltransferase involved in cell wall biosynthesis
MKVKATKYPNVETEVDGLIIRFIDGYAEMDEGRAMKLTAMNPDYVIVREELGGGFIKFDGKNWTDKYKKIIWDGPVGYANGYGKGSMMLLEAVGDRVDAYSVASNWTGSSTDYVPEKLQKILDKPADKIDSFYVMFFPAWEFSRKISERFIGYTMLECTKIPESWVNSINRYCERVIVPCEQQRQAFLDSGVTVDVKSIPLGLTPELFPERDYEKKDDTFIFGSMGTLTYRKGTDLLVRAFKETFPKDKYPNVHLYLKTLSVGGIASMWFMDKQDLKDDRIIFNADMFSPTELVENFFHTLDCFVFPTRGEGFGLPPLEAMMTGLPVICTTMGRT